MSSIDAPAGLTIRDCAAGSETLLALCRDFEQGRMPSATLLCGESGTGKKTLAHLLAQGLLCTGSGSARPCGTCRDCKRFSARTHPNALFPSPAPREKTIRVDTLRDTIGALSRHALEGGARVVVIDNAERMTPQAQNALLKTLEEAEEGTYFLLTADVETAILPTIRSRCRCVRVQPWPEERIRQALQARGIPQERAHTLARFCEGSLGRALAMQEDEGYWAARDLVRRTFLNVESPGDMARAAALLKDQKEEGGRLLDILEQEIRTLLHWRILNREDPDDDFPSFFSRASVPGLRRILESILTARRQRASNVGWAALSEGLMQTISEEANTWRQ